MALIVNSANFDQEVVKSTIPVVIDVFATWCGPCKQMGPVFEELAKEVEGKYKLVKLNIDEDRDVAIQYNISSIPTFVFVKDGKMVGKETGSMSKETLKNKIQSHFGS
jgi:thioredoxin 1